MGPLANARRVEAMEAFVADAVAKGAKVKTGGKRIGNKGFFFEPTVLTDVPLDARVMNEEPFGPIAPIMPFTEYDEVEIGRAHVCTPVTNAHLVCRLLLAKKKSKHKTHKSH